MFLSVYLDNIKMVGRKESWAPMWATLRKMIELEDPTPSIDDAFLECILRAATVDEDSIKTTTEMIRR